MSGTIKLVGQDTSSPAVPLPGAGESLPMIPPDLQPESGHATTYVEGVSPSAPDTGEAPLPPVARPISVAIVARAEAIIMRGGYVRDKKEQWSAFLISLGNEVPSGEIPHVILALLKCLESEQVGMLVSEEDNFIYQAAIWTGLGKNLTESCYALGHDLIEPLLKILQVDKTRFLFGWQPGDFSPGGLLFGISKASPYIEQRRAMAQFYLENSDPCYTNDFIPGEGNVRQLVRTLPESLRAPFIEYSAGGDIFSGMLTWNYSGDKSRLRHFKDTANVCLFVSLKSRYNPAFDTLKRSLKTTSWTSRRELQLSDLLTQEALDEILQYILNNFEKYERDWQLPTPEYFNEEHIVRHITLPLSGMFHLLSKNDQLLWAGRLTEMFKHLEQNRFFRITGGHHHIVLDLGEVVIPELTDYPQEQRRYVNLIAPRLDDTDPTTRWVAVNALRSALPALPRETPRKPYLDPIAKMAAHDVDLDVRVIAIRTVGEFLSTLTEAESQAFPELHQVMNRLQRHEHWAVRGMANRYKHSQATSTEGAGAGIGEEDAILEDAFSLDEIPESIDSQGKPRRLNLSQVKDRKALQAATHNRQVHISTKPARLWSPVAHARAGMMARNIIR